MSVLQKIGLLKAFSFVVSVGVFLAAVNNLKCFRRHTPWQPWESDVPVLFPGSLSLSADFSLWICGMCS